MGAKKAQKNNRLKEENIIAFFHDVIKVVGSNPVFD